MVRYCMRFIFHFQVENPQAVLFHLNKPYVSHNDFYYDRTKNFGFCVLIPKQNKEKKKIYHENLFY